MAFQHNLQENRFELKYIIHEVCARAIRDFVRSYLEPDPFADPNHGFAYAIHSLYLDSPGLALCRSTIQGHKNRFKLRIRYYDDKPASPVFFEIKRRVNDAILKRRAAVHREAVSGLLDGQWPEMRHLAKPNEKSLDSLRQFCDLRRQIHAQGQVIVSYWREAWVSPQNDHVRLTFDRHLSAMPWEGALTCRGFEDGRHPDIRGVVLELKFTDRFPMWMRNLVHIFNLQRTSMPKYVECILATKSRENLTHLPAFEAVR